MTPPHSIIAHTMAAPVGRSSQTDSNRPGGIARDADGESEEIAPFQWRWVASAGTIRLANTR